MDVGDVGLEHLLEELHRTAAVAPGQHPRVHDTAQCRAMRRPRNVVVDHLRDLIAGEVVVEPVEQLAQLLGRQQVQQHQRVRLLRGLVPIDVVVLCFQNAVQALNVAVAL